MALIEFKDLPDTSTPLNAENLNNNFNALKGEVLFEGSTTGNITLNDSVSNYDILEIFYKNQDGYSDSKRIHSPNNKIVSLDLSYYNNGTQNFQHWTGNIEISNTSITHSIDYYYENSGGTTNAPQTINYIQIEKVIGYKTGIFN